MARADKGVEETSSSLARLCTGDQKGISGSDSETAVYLQPCNHQDISLEILNADVRVKGKDNRDGQEDK